MPIGSRMPVYPHATGYFGLGNSLAQQFRRFATALLQGFEISTNPGWISHARRVARDYKNVTILFNAQ